MNRTGLKDYAPQARRDFIQAMTDRAAFYGITAKKVEPMTIRGDAVVIAGREYPKAIADKRTRLEERIRNHGFAQTIDAVAYSWFNRFVALRYMEVHGYLEHGYRVLSHPEGKAFPEILEHAEHLHIPSLDKSTVIDLKLAGNKENDLYRLILLAQCNALHDAMPFLFEEINDATELLLPESLLNSDSLIRKLVDEIAEDDWQQVEIIGWLYQYYISEKKDEVIGKVVASEDIPAATQLFTPNWIVRYLVHNTLGRKWLATYPDSSIRSQMEFYIEPAEQEPEVQAKLKEITPESLNPEEITFLDPACGSGHILVEAYDLFKAIYQERGYRTKDIPSLILQKNVFGFEIDDRAAQLAMFALLMKARADDRRILDSKVQPNIVCFIESKGLKPTDLVTAINQYIDGIGPGNISQFDLGELVELFEHAKTFGSLIQVSPSLQNKLVSIETRVDSIERTDDFAWRSLKFLPVLVKQAKALAAKYDVVVANPPYMGNKYFTPNLKDFLKDKYQGFEKDLFSSFIFRNISFCKDFQYFGICTSFTWMFISSFKRLRDELIDNENLLSLVQLEYDGYEEARAHLCVFTGMARCIIGYKSSFIKLTDFYGAHLQGPKTLEAIQNKKCGWFFEAKPSDFKKIPGSPIAYWANPNLYKSFSDFERLDQLSNPRKGMVTADNPRFIRYWYEVSSRKISFKNQSREEAKASKAKWFPYQKGGPFRRWYGNNLAIVNWEHDGLELMNMQSQGYKVGSTNHNLDFIFKEAIVWSKITSASQSFRKAESGFLFDDASGLCPLKNLDNLEAVISYLNSPVCDYILGITNPTLNLQPGNLCFLPIPINDFCEKNSIREIIQLFKNDWNSIEESWDFDGGELKSLESRSIKEMFENTKKKLSLNIQKAKIIEEKTNLYWIKKFGLADTLTNLIPDHQISLRHFNLPHEANRLVSFFVGCIMGRYSFDHEGLVYAHSNNEGFDSSKYKTIPADNDGIVPLLNKDWGVSDDATERFVQFVSVAWPIEHLEENLRFVAESLGGPPEDSARDVIRNYFSTGFYKHHLQIYKRRPIYWLFSSGKQKAFQALVYLHRYNEGTLSRMRTEYVIPLQGKISGRIEQLEADKLTATSTSQRKKFQKEQDDLKKQQAELLVFDEKLKNYADQRIKLDLDDGVKVNYAKFGDLLAEVKAVTGGSDE